ncbi:Protein FAR1-RELATED SEQUENCE 5 [Linum perenne]
MKYDEYEDKYKIYKWEAKHNHEFNNEELRPYMKSSRKMHTATGAMTQVNKNAGIPLRSSWDVLCGHLGGEGNVGCTKVDLKNFLGKIRQRQMMYGEETAINEYFRGKKEYGLGFYYNVEVDAREDMANIFWADQQMQDDYAAFGDSITFDTTYRTNRNCRPLGEPKILFIILS